MDPVMVFVNYATRFEQALVDGDWQKVCACFHADASYEVGGVPPFGGTYQGREAIAAYYARVTNGLDHRFERRELALVDGPVVRGAGVWARWAGDYSVAGAPDLPLAGELFATTDGAQIARYEERYADGTWTRVAEWLASHGAKLKALDAP